MSQRTVTVDGKSISTDGSIIRDVVRDKRAVAARVGGRLVDLSAPLDEGQDIETVPADSDEGVHIIRHSAAHVMAEAVKQLFPDAKPTIGPATEDGFYYDFDRSQSFTPEDLEKIEKKMEELVKADLPFIRKDMSRQEAIAFFREKGEPYKVEIIQDMDDDVCDVSLYEQGSFVDLCRGPHVPSTGYIKAFKLLSIAGAYWRGDEKNQMLQRIYGTAFSSPKELKNYLDFLEEAKKRDHRKLGRELDLFMFSDDAGPGLVIYMPKGGRLRSLIEEFEKKLHFRRGYDIVYGPNILRGRLWEISGHMDNYKENMYFTELDGQLYGIKPMNCLSHIMIYKSKVRSYRDLPLRYFELGSVTRNEKSGVIHGLLRTRQFTQDDAHIFCRPDQLIDEITAIIDMVADVMAIFGFSYDMEISTRPEQSMGSEEMWDMATQALKDALDKKGLPYDINEGDGAFYGPKIDVKIKDAIGRSWQCATIQCDFQMPERFDMHYIGSDGERHRPVMLHRVILGSIERFIGVLIEHFAGAFPVWIAPVQAVVMNITDAQADYAADVAARLRANDVRIELDTRNEKIGYKIREARQQKVPYMVIMGDREKEEGTITVRERSGDQKTMTVDEFIKIIREAQPVI
ncbi:MAG: threonine--tRNA ligase [Desulfomonilia bacterium]|mgnify:FL=1|jgi:threonyl-tRNA synthetase|uniref:threonine--tRNA ligase n=1 Tax=anaerobic digester metagenome TaxID=1263854 RepID=A0A485M6W7_9ZZZZ|nr:threonine--tRNA ligase [Pseudomonadota bacterium]HPD22411.1 threonine--tRNA ligase [Deltaproteobacteria bacterium]HRS57223.1 threonine--tRNA ligase [Desulfomonilia bacterium]HRV36493.1 threonine--tRNA ligase [Desulfomonilia bacterium]